MATKSKHVAALEAQLSSPDERIRHEAALELSRLDRLKQSRRKPDALKPLRDALAAAQAELETERQAREQLEACLTLVELAKPDDNAPPKAPAAPPRPAAVKVTPKPVLTVPEPSIAFTTPPEDWCQTFARTQQPRMGTHAEQLRAKAAAEACDMADDYERQENAERAALIQKIKEGRAREASLRAWNAHDFARQRERDATGK